MKARNNKRQRGDLHAEVYHRSKIDKLREEGDHLRRELRQRGVDPALILSEVHQQRRSHRRA